MTRAGFSLAAGVAVAALLGASLMALAEGPTSANYKLAVTAVNNGVADMVTTAYKLSSSIGDVVFNGPHARVGVVWP